jgi:hypothetical protein
MTTSSSTSSTEEEEYLILHTSNGDYEITQDDIPRILMDAVWALEPDDQPDIDDIDPNAEVSQWPGNVRLQILYFAQKCWFPGNDTESSYWNPNWLEQAKDVLDAHLGMLVGNPGPNYQTFRNGRRTAGVELWGNIASGSEHLLPPGMEQPHDDDPVFVIRERVEGAWSIIEVTPPSAT